MKYSILLFMLFIFASSTAQNSILFELSKPGLKHKSYLFGTMHVQHEKAFNFNDSVFWAINQCKKAAFEMELNEAAFENLSAERSKLFDSTFKNSLIDFIRNDFIPKLIKEIPANELAATISEDIIPAFKEYLKLYENENNRIYFVDQYLQNYARKSDLEITGIETGEEQLRAIFGDFFKVNLKNSGLSEKIIALLKSDNSFSNFSNLTLAKESMIEMYSRGDLNSICKHINSISKTKDAFTSGLIKRVFWDRNQIMFNRTIEPAQNEPIFIAVGSGHLCGKNGLLELYRKAGFKVRAMSSHVKTNIPIQWKKFETEYFSVEVPENIQPDTIFKYTEVEIEPNYLNNNLFTTKGRVSFIIKKHFIESSTMDIEEDYFNQNYKEEGYTFDEEYDEEWPHDDSIYEDSYDDEEINSDIEFPPPMPDWDEIDMPENTIQEKRIPDFKKSPFGDEFTEQELKYFNELKDSLTNVLLNFKSSMHNDFYYKKKDSLIHFVNSENIELELLFAKRFENYTLKTTIIVNDYYGYELIITGDREILLSEDLRRFFATFRLKE